jgi:hypothetical protein
MSSVSRRRVGGHVRDTYLNAGLMAGRTSDLLALIEKMDILDEEDDQAVLTDLLHHAPHMLRLDYEQMLFGNTRWAMGLNDGCVFSLDRRSGALIHSETGTTPILIHNPGKFWECHDRLAGALQQSPARHEPRGPGGWHLRGNHVTNGNDGGDYDNYGDCYGNYGYGSYGNYGYGSYGNYASYVHYGNYRCHGNYWIDGTICSECTTSACGVGFYRGSCGASSDAPCQACTGKPLNAFYVSAGSPANVDNCNWTCNAGYWIDGTICSECTTSACAVGLPPSTSCESLRACRQQLGLNDEAVNCLLISSHDKAMQCFRRATVNTAVP